ncbi:Nucleolar GTP-binding protein 2 [Trichinella sp. T9]|nr:Nucleolar GTP-binding protein 2 [Trichinella sp. T9]
MSCFAVSVMARKRKQSKPFKDRISKANHSLNADRTNKTVPGQRSRATVRRLLMYKNFKAKRDRYGKIIREAPFQKTLSSGSVARVEPNRRWFGNTKVIGQDALQKFQENLNKVRKDPYLYVMRQTKLPVTLLNEKAKHVRPHLLDTETFQYTFGRKAQRKKPRLMTMDLQHLVDTANEQNCQYVEDRDRDFQKTTDTNERYEPIEPIFKKGQSKRIWNELYKVLDSSDVVCEVVDARDPMGTRCFNVEKFLRKEKPHKHIIIILNKVDLIPRWVTRDWIRTLSAEYPTIAFSADMMSPFGKGALISILRQFAHLHQEHPQISVGFIGFPNVGKSSIINALRRKKVCNVAPIAGETKVWQYVTLMRRIYLIDCPGIVYPTGNNEAQLILKGVIRVENVKDAADYIDAVIERVKREYLVRTYQVPEWKNSEEFLSALAGRSGRLLKGGEPDINTVAKMVLNDFQRGRLPYYVKPPGKNIQNDDQPTSSEMVESVLMDKSVAVDQDLTKIELTTKYNADDVGEKDVVIALSDSEDLSSLNVCERSVKQEHDSEYDQDDLDSCSGLSDICEFENLKCALSEQEEQPCDEGEEGDGRRAWKRKSAACGNKMTKNRHEKGEKFARNSNIIDFTKKEEKSRFQKRKKKKAKHQQYCLSNFSVFNQLWLYWFGVQLGAKMTNNETLYSGFDELATSFNSEEILNNKPFVQATSKSTSYGRQVTREGNTDQLLGNVSRLSSTDRSRLQLASGRPLPTSKPQSSARPMTSVRGAGYSSFGHASPYENLPINTKIPEKWLEDSTDAKCRKLEQKVITLLKCSAAAVENSELKQALEFAKEAVRRERALAKLREQQNIIEQPSLDLTFSVLFNLAQQYEANELYSEAISMYETLTMNKMFPCAADLGVNIGRIYMRQEQFSKAIQYFQQALEQVPSVQRTSRRKIINNIGVALTKLKRYEDAISRYEQSLQIKADFPVALNALLCAFLLNDKHRMKTFFLNLLEISLEISDEAKYFTDMDNPTESLFAVAIRSDMLRQFEMNRKKLSERTILTAANLISSRIANKFADDIADDMEINKAIEFLKCGDVTSAHDIFRTFEKKDSRASASALNNMALISLLQENYKDAAEQLEKALASDRYNPSALVNRGNVAFFHQNYEEAWQFYREAWTHEAHCIEAVFNSGLTCRVCGKYEDALEFFQKLRGILCSNTQVLVQIAETYTQANSIAQTDPSILVKLGELYEKEGDRQAAFHFYSDSFRYYPSDLNVIQWLGAYYIEANISEKAIHYFEKASLIQPNEIRWQLMIAGCLRRCGNYTMALQKYKDIHSRFPDDIQCMQHIVRLANDLGLPDAETYANTLKKMEKTKYFKYKDSQRFSPSKRESAEKTPNARRTSTGSRKMIVDKLDLLENDSLLDSFLPE